MNLWEFIDRRLALRELKKSGLATPESWLLSLGGTTGSGEVITHDTAVSITPVFACVRILAGLVGSAPLHVYRRTAAGKERATDHPLYRVLHDQPGSELNSVQWREAMAASMLLHGNAYSGIDMDVSRGVVKSLEFVSAERVSPKREENTGEIIYEVMTKHGSLVTLRRWQMLHIPHLAFDGIVGLSPVAAHREAFGLARVTEKHGAEFFGEGARPGISLEHPGAGSPLAARNIREQFLADHKGRHHGVAVLFDGMKLNTYSIPNEDAQFLQTRSFQVAEIARIFGVPLWMLMEQSKDTSWGSGIEQQFIAFNVITLAPILRKIEAALNSSVLSATDSEEGYFCEFDMKGLLRGDFAQRVIGYSSALRDGWMNRNEVRGLENLNTVDGLDEFLVSAGGSAMRPAGGGGQAAQVDRAAWHPLLRECWARILRRYRNDYAGAAKRDALVEFRREHAEWAASELGPVVVAAGASVARAVRVYSAGAEVAGLVDADPSGWDGEHVMRLAGRCADSALEVLND